MFKVYSGNDPEYLTSNLLLFHTMVNKSQSFLSGIVLQAMCLTAKATCVSVFSQLGGSFELCFGPLEPLIEVFLVQHLVEGYLREGVLAQEF